MFSSRIGVCYSVPVSTPQTARARVRAEITREILAAAHEELAAEGAAGLSLRAVARRLDMVPSALYRYFSSREALLTALIVEAYEAVGAAAEAADRGARPLTRWLSVAGGVRGWAHEHPHEWALIYGSPVPGYAAPRETVEAALQITRVIAGIFADAVAPGAHPPAWLPPAPRSLPSVIRPLESELLPGRPPETVVAAILAWTQLLGMVSLELFGHYVGATTDFDVVFTYAMRSIGAACGLGA
jgi:AcrR family transcriptional regulator